MPGPFTEPGGVAGFFNQSGDLPYYSDSLHIAVEQVTGHDAVFSKHPSFKKLAVFHLKAFDCLVGDSVIKFYVES